MKDRCLNETVGIMRTFKSVIKRIIAKIFNKSLPFITAIIKESKLDLIRLNPNIELGKNVYISNDSKIETRYGGSIKIGDNVIIFDGVLILSDGGDVRIGNGCQINPYSIIYGTGCGTKIGSDVLIAGHCMIIPANHTFSDKSSTIKNQTIRSKGIIIGDDVWIAHGSTITDGITIGKGAVIAAGAVVNESVPPYTVYGGMPAEYIKDR